MFGSTPLSINQISLLVGTIPKRVEMNNSSFMLAFLDFLLGASRSMLLSILQCKTIFHIVTILVTTKALNL
jgi:hypothetical protein